MKGLKVFGVLLAFVLLLGTLGLQYATYNVVKVPQVAPVSIVPTVAVVPPEKLVREGTYYFLAANNSSPFYVPGVKGFTEAGKEVGMKTAFVGPMDASTTEQMKTFEELIASPETKGIFWYAMDFNVGQPLVEQAQAKGIPVVIGGGDSPFKTRKAFVGYDNTILGTQAAIWADKLIGCKGSVGTVAINGVNLDARTNAFNAYFAKNCPDVKIVPRATHDGSATNEAAVLEAYLVANPDLTLLWWADGDASNIVQVLKDKQTQGNKTMVLAMDMPNATLQAVKDGIFVGSVGQDTETEERWGVYVLDAINKGYRVPDTLFLSAILVDKSNVDQFLGK